MFKYLTRNLKLGLTTLTILTAGAGAAFAQPAGFNTAIDPIDDCSSGGGRKPSYCTIQVVNCIDNPFGTDSYQGYNYYGVGGCATTLGAKAYTVAKVRYCGDASHRAKPACASTVAGVNAAHWAKENPDISTLPDTVNRHSHFLKGLAADLDTNGLYITHRGTLYFDTATFDGRALGGDATDGVAFFLGRGNNLSNGINNWGTFHAGILSGTDLGVPITQTSGTASWVGQFQTVLWDTDRDFVLEITFGGDGDKAGSIEAFVQQDSGSRSFHLKGDFNDSGLITGVADARNFTDNDRHNPTGYRFSGPLTGLIGQEGAAGVFYRDGYYAGGFVARPPSELDTAFLNRTCSADPFTNRHQDLCYLEYADDRVTRINDCITGGNASDASQCGTAIAEHSCISNPFASNCAADFADYYETAQANRIQFCLGDLTNTLCTNSLTVAGICTYAPFASVCFNGNTYESARTNKINFCHTNTTHASCSGVTSNPNAVAWADSFATAPTDRPSTTNRRNQFLKGTASGVNKGDIVVDRYDSSLNLNTATFNRRALGGDAADGVAYFRGQVNGRGTLYYYSGIFSGTDLGAPITDLSGTASWVGKFQSIYHNVNRDFVLEVDYTNKSVDAFVHWSGGYHFQLEGDYDDKGVITGDFNLSYFNNKDRESKTSTYIAGTVTGLIGQEGAVGAFHSIASFGYSGGFVARPANVDDKSYLNTTCTNDPFGYLCYLETDKQRTKIIECTEGSNASGAGCERAAQLNTCLTNPFHSDCVTDFADYYVAARTKRTEFCVGDLTNSLCTGTGAKEAICTYAPFASICFDNNDYDTARTTKYTSCHADPSIPSCTGVTDRPNAIAWADSFATALADTPAPPTDGTTRGNQFLKGTASGVNKGDIIPYLGLDRSLNLNTAEFNGEDLGGDATDGVAFFIGRVNGQGTWYYYSGIFSGTDLGAPITQTSGTASWVGRFRELNYSTNKEFVLEIDFNGTGDKSGYIKAFVQRYETGGRHFYLDGSYDAHGVITGTVDYGYFTNNDRDSRSTRTPNGTLTGLIGKDGAVGAFISNQIGSAYTGGFVARPPTNAELDYVTTTCEDDPFHPFCHVDYEEQRAERIGDCTASNDAATNTAFCGRAIVRNPCIRNPFTANCAEDLEHHYATARTNRIQFCLGDLTNTLCTNSDTVAAVCTYAPFASVCFDDEDTYESTRTNKINFCHTNTTDLSCSGVTDNPNAVAWADSFATALTDTPSTTNRSNQFLKGTASGVNKGDIVTLYSYNEGSLNLNTATFNGRALGGDAADGVAFFRGAANSEGRMYYYSGILSGTDLGAPLGPRATDGKTTASWVGKFQSLYFAVNKDFVLEVDYANKTLDAFVYYSSGTHYYLNGNYDDKGVITGDFNLHFFNNRDRKSKSSNYYAGVVTGLIGQEGAVGAFHSSRTTSSGYSGGFVARPANVADNSYLNTTCTNDPFGYLCYLETDKQRDKIIECTEGSNASTSGCERAAELNPCINNPFATDCVTDFADYYVAARTKRTEFCVGDLTNSLCTEADAVEAICTYAPFASVCFDDNEYKTARETKYPTCHADPSILSCTGVTDRPNAIAWADSFATALSDRPAAPTDGTTRDHQFLKATASGVNKGDIVLSHSSHEGSLNLNTAKFNGEATLGGDAADGVAFFRGRVNNQGRWYWYAGIFSGTDLGAPVTDLSGTASWVGRFQEVGRIINKEFVLEIDFNGTGDKSGYIKAFVQYFGIDHFYLDGSYDAHGVITGTVDFGVFTNNDRDSSTRTPNGTLTGLIGQDGAVGAFISNYNSANNYAGGFVARPSTKDAELDYVAITCEEDPFHQFCHLDYEEHRDARIRECTDEYGTINDAAICAKAIAHNPCITNPFADKCVDEFEFYYEDARANRAKFCNKATNASDSLCTGAVSDICDYDPFTAICFDSGNPYNTPRIEKTTYCADRANIGDVSCAGAFSRPNVASLLKGFTTELTKVPNPSPTKNRFLQGTDVGLDNGTLEIYRNRQLVTLTLADNLATGTSLGGQAADGVAFFGSRVNGKYFYYAGILSGTDLGAPLPTTTEKNVKALWNGKIQTMGLYRIEKDFTLEVTYIGSGNHAGNVEAFVNRLGSSYYYLNGKFDNSGVIFDGTVNYGRFTESKRDNPVGGRAPNGELRGLIGQDGAVGAFISNGFGNYSGGFVARPPQ